MLKDIQNKEFNFDKIIKFGIIFLIFVLSGIFGFIYETLFYRIDLGYFVKRGTTFGPWIPIYGFGGLFISLISYKNKDNPLKVFLISCVVSAILELLTGYVLFHVFNLRLWDYNTEIWNFGNVGGYICLRSIVFFGISGIFLMNIILPFAKMLASKMNKKVFCIITYLLGILFIIDIISNIIIKIF